jgi:imidazolonepropionase
MRNGFLEVEAGSETFKSAGRLFREAAGRQLPVKLSWVTRPDEALFDLLAAFPFRTISHLRTTDDRVLAALLEKQTTFVMAGGEPALRLDPRAFRLREFVDANGGIALSSGYDPVDSPTFTMQMAIALAVARMELTPEEAITAATLNAAHAIGAGRKVGSLEAGKQADLLVLNLTSYRDLPRQFGINHVGMVIRAGEVVFNRIGWKPPRLEFGWGRA